MGEKLHIFQNLEDFVVENDHPPPSSIKTCHLVSPQHEAEVNRRLLSSGLCILVEEEEVVRDSIGRPFGRWSFWCGR